MEEGRIGKVGSRHPALGYPQNNAFRTNRLSALSGCWVQLASHSATRLCVRFSTMGYCRDSGAAGRVHDKVDGEAPELEGVVVARR